MGGTEGGRVVNLNRLSHNQLVGVGGGVECRLGTEMAGIPHHMTGWGAGGGHWAGWPVSCHIHTAYIVQQSNGRWHCEPTCISS